MFDIELAGRTSNSQRRRKNYRRWWKGYEQSQIWLFLLPMDWGFNECRSQKKKKNQDERRKWEKKDENRKSDHWEDYAGAGCRRNQWGRAGPAALPPLLLVPCSGSVRRLRWTSGQQVSAQEGARQACHDLSPIRAAVIDSQWQIRGWVWRGLGERWPHRQVALLKLAFGDQIVPQSSLLVRGGEQHQWKAETYVGWQLEQEGGGGETLVETYVGRWTAALSCEQAWATFLFNSLISPPCHGASSQPWVRMNPQILWGSDQTESQSFNV